MSQQPWLRNLDITVLPILVRFGEEVYRDGVDLSSDEFYQKLVSRKDFPHSAFPSPGEIA
jgi:fatty acid-binding protein DegV